MPIPRQAGYHTGCSVSRAGLYLDICILASLSTQVDAVKLRRCCELSDRMPSLRFPRRPTLYCFQSDVHTSYMRSLPEVHLLPPGPSSGPCRSRCFRVQIRFLPRWVYTPAATGLPSPDRFWCPGIDPRRCTRGDGNKLQCVVTAVAVQRCASSLSYFLSSPASSNFKEVGASGDTGCAWGSSLLCPKHICSLFPSLLFAFFQVYGGLRRTFMDFIPLRYSMVSCCCGT